MPLPLSPTPIPISWRLVADSCITLRFLTQCTLASASWLSAQHVGASSVARVRRVSTEPLREGGNRPSAVYTQIAADKRTPPQPYSPSNLRIFTNPKTHVAEVGWAGAHPCPPVVRQWWVQQIVDDDTICTVKPKFHYADVP